MTLTIGSYARRDVYANLLRDTRGLRREQASARDSWFAGLPWERKEDTLFELEMLLKGIACFGNSRNHSGPPRRTPSVAHDFTQELRILRETVDRCVALTRQLLGDKDRAYTFSRYLESVLPEDAERSKLVREQLTQDTPVEALFVLRNAFSSNLDIVDGMMRLGRVSHRLFFALHGQLTREIGRNTYFNPLVTLEFRSEFDRIRSAEVLEALEQVPSESSHRVVAMAFLTLFRALKYLDLVDSYAGREELASLGFIILSVFRSDMRALTRFLGERAADVMADGFEGELLGVTAADLETNHQKLAHVAASLVALRGSLETTANTLRIEVRKTFERGLPGVDNEFGGGRVGATSAGNAPAPPELGPVMILASAELRASLHHAIHTLCNELRPGQRGPDLATTSASRKASSARLRRDVWMFAQILRAFLAKAKAAPVDADNWAAQSSFQFVREFLLHFRAIGYQLVRVADYERLDPFLRALEQLQDVDLLEAERMKLAVEECTAFFHYLEQLFGQVTRREELADLPFDKKQAAETLKIYLGAL
ncbi:MAG: hypothetical protein AAGF12_17635 [Myxococcota bacterium]